MAQTGRKRGPSKLPVTGPGREDDLLERDFEGVEHFILRHYG
jgi:hypothetical protein